MNSGSLQLADWVNEAWIKAQAKYPDLLPVIEQGKKNIAYNFEVLAKEIFARLIGCQPDRLPAIKPEVEWIAAIHHKLERNLDWKLLCDSSAKVSEVEDCSAIALNSFLVWLLKSIPYPTRPLLENVEDLRAAVLELKSRVPGLDLSGMIDKGKDATEELKIYALAVEAMPADEVSRMCREAYQQFDRLIEPIVGTGVAMAGLGIGGDINDKAKFNKALQASKKLKNIINLAGKLIKRADALQDCKDDKGKHTVDGVEMGDELGRATGESIQESKTDWLSFAAKFITKSVGQFRLGMDAKKEGPIVILLDDTGSMGAIDPESHFSRETWAKAVCWAIMAIANRQGRHCRLIHYGDGVRRVDDFESGDRDLTRWLETMEFFFDDGTNYEAAGFNAAMDCIETVDSYSGADIVFITDGGWNCGASAEQMNDEKSWLKTFPQRLKDSNVAVYTVLINCGSRGLPKFLSEDESGVNQLVFVGDLANDAQIDQLFEAL